VTAVKILYIHQYFVTRAGATGTRSYEFATRWAQAGHRVHVLTGASYDSTLSRPGDRRVDGVDVTVLGVRYDNRMGFLRRVWAFFRFAAQSMRRAMCSRDVDVVLATSTPLTVALPMLIAKWFARRRVVFEVRDVWPDAAVQAGVLKNPLLIAAARSLERLAYRHADHIVALSAGMRDRILSKGDFAAKLTVIPNCSDLDLFDPGRSGETLRGECNAAGKFIILYVGAISLANDVDCLAEAARLLMDEPDIEWWFVAGGSQAGVFQRSLQEAGVRNVRFFGLQPKQRIPGFVATADVGIVSFLSAPVFYENSPNKFFDYVAGGLPVVFNRDSWVQEYLDKYDAGFCCRNSDAADLASRIRWLRDNPDDRKRMGRNARQMAEREFSRDVLTERYLTLLLEIAQKADR